MNTDLQVAMIELIIAYTLVGAFVFTVIITCLSMIGVVKLADPNQQKKLFAILICQLVIGCVGFFFKFIRINPKDVQENIAKPYIAKADQLSDQNAKLSVSLTSAVQNVAAFKAQAQVSEDQLAAAKTELVQTKQEYDALNTRIANLQAASTVAVTQAQREAANSKAELAKVTSARDEAVARAADLESRLRAAQVAIPPVSRGTTVPVSP